MKPMKPITVLLAEDHAIVREGLRGLLELQGDIHVIGEAEDGRTAVGLAATLRPDIIVMDIAMPLLNGLEATRQILTASPSTKVVILSAHSDEAYVERVVELGARGYLIKQSAAHVLPEAIREIHKGRTYFSPTIDRRQKDKAERSRLRGEPRSHIVKLTPRETEVLQLVAEGKANMETADILGISVKTVEKHRQSVMEKLNIHDTAGLTRYAISTGVIENSVQRTTV